MIFAFLTKKLWWVRQQFRNTAKVLPIKMHISRKKIILILLALRQIKIRLKSDRLHYENTPMQYAAIFKGCKNGNFQMKNCDIFLIFAQNIDCGYTLELPH